MSEERWLGQLRAKLPKPVKRAARFAASYPGIYKRLLDNYRYDLQRFLRASSVSGRFGTDGKLRAWIEADVHKIEKALALKDPRTGFGKPVVNRLIDSLELYAQAHGNAAPVPLALNTLEAYRRFHDARGAADQAMWARIEGLATRASAGEFCGGGVLHVDRAHVLARAERDLASFFEARHSIRHFAAEPVDPMLIERAVRMAQRTPSVCNRQASKVHVYSEPVDRQRVLACQQGNRGFGEQAQVALVVTVDLETFFSVGERNQAWIDGGMFAMTLVWALHSLGLGCCCLNWSVERERDAHVHEVGGIPDTEVVIMMIAVGHLPETLNVAQSVRRPLEEVLRRGTTRDVAPPDGA
jgi:nitroreductase